MSDRTETRKEASVGEFYLPTDSGAENSSHDSALRRELHSISSVRTNQSDIPIRKETQALDAASSLPPLSIDGREAKVAPELPKELLERTTKPSTRDLTGEEPLLVPPSEELRQVVGREREQEYHRAFELLASFQKSVNENIASPCIQRFADRLDQVERHMPKEKFNALEEERKKYGLELEAFEKLMLEQLVQEQLADEEAPLSNLLYILPPQPPVRGKEMQEFDRTVKGIAGGVATEMKEDVAAGVANLTKRDGSLISAEQLVQDYYERLEKLTTTSDEPEIRVLRTMKVKRRET